MMDHLAADLTELCPRDELRELLNLGGYPATGSHYEQFVLLCRVAELMPEHPTVVRLQALLAKTFACSLPLSAAHAAELWRLTSEKLLLQPTASKELEKLAPPPPAHAAPISAELPHFVLFRPCLEAITAVDWQYWEREAKQLLQTQCKEGSLPLLSLPADMTLQKPDLYHIERVLRGEAEDRDRWLAQLLTLLCGFCRDRDIRLGLQAECSADVLLSLLHYATGRTPLPELVLLCEGVELSMLSSLAYLVVNTRTPASCGLLPVLCEVTRTRDEIPQALLCRTELR